MTSEYHIPPNTIILSTSDKHGNIISCNENLVTISGYSYNELIGKPHRILRHPETPQSIFFDLWRTIEQGHSWSSVIKNRRKNGDYYWIATTISPVFEGTEITGYASVRYPATDAQKEHAQQLYCQNGQIANQASHKIPYLYTISLLALIVISGIVLPMVTTLPVWFGASMSLSAIPIAFSLYVVANKTNKTNTFGTIKDIISHKMHNSVHTLCELAFFDELTKLPSRLNIINSMTRMISELKPDTNTCMLIKININRLTMINDALGYEQGDTLLVMIGARLTQHLPKHCTVGRNSGDEFLILVTACQNIPQDTFEIQLSQALTNAFLAPFILPNENAIHITASFAGTRFPQAQADTADSILRRAMIALHQVKGYQTKNIMFYQPEMEEKSQKYLDIETRLHYAIEQDHLQLFLQSQVNTQGQVVSAEALVRWQDPERGLIFPNDFIPIAEQSDLIIDLDRWVLRKSCEHLKSLQNANINFHLSVNISGKHFNANEFVDNIYNIISETEINPNYLILEVTESVFMSDLTQVIAKMDEVRKLGIIFSIDDFGTGYSSLLYLKRLPIQELKIDKGFINELPHNAEDVVLVKTIIAIAQNLNLQLVIEGVETQEQADFLNQLGNFTHQGYLYGKPQPAQQVIQSIFITKELHDSANNS
jgi:diguanylate cyclase (GGDEF)-like protein/PAS domain S-box-containing protein